jgi:hypothetical protein
VGEQAKVTLEGTHSGISGLTFHYGSRTITAFAGEYAWIAAAGSHNPWPLNQSFESFCVDLNDSVAKGGTYTYTLKTLDSSPNPYPENPTGGGMGAVRADALRRLWGTYRADVTADNIKAAAFQMAIWEIIFDTTHIPGAGTLPAQTMSVMNQDGAFYMEYGNSSSTSYKVAAKANFYLSNLYQSFSKIETNLAVMSCGNDVQDQLVVMPMPAAACGGLLLFGVTAGMKRTRRQQVA